MRKSIALSAALASLSATALAADLPSRKEPPLAPPPPIWTGFFLGVNAGGTWTNTAPASNVTWPIGTQVASALRIPGSISSLNGEGASGGSTGFIAGGQIGYNRQMSFNDLNFVAGLEADIQGIASSGGGSTKTNVFPGTVPGDLGMTYLKSSSSLNYLGTVRARIGYLVTPEFLVYGTGGFAYGDVSLNQNSYQTFFARSFRGITYNAFGNSSNSGIQVGYAAGGGAEWMFMQNWSAKAEYLYYDLGSLSGTSDMTAFPTRITNLRAPYSWMTTSVNARFNGNIVRAGVNYHFNWGVAPVVAAF